MTRPGKEESTAAPATTRPRTSLEVVGAKPPASAGASTLPATATPRSAEEEIRRRAYELYEQEGRQDGRDQEHWLRAETELLGRHTHGRKSA
jgi:hypothetical protein